MSQTFFFTDPNTFHQSDAYGPKGDYYDPNTGLVYDQFLVTSMHTGESCPAIAVTKGVIFMQEQEENSELLNIVLQPFYQPPFEFPRIRYYIYKGIRKESVVNLNSGMLADPNGPFLQYLWDTYQALNSGGQPPVDLLGLVSGIARMDRTEPLESAFTNKELEFQPLVVNAGWKLGMFNPASFGFEIMFDNLGYEPTMALARNHEHYVRVKQDPKTSHAEFFEHWHDKEEILNYVDPSAFYGSFINHRLRVRFKEEVKSIGYSDDLFEHILNCFENGSVCYLDIRNEFNFSVNYFKNYGDRRDEYTCTMRMAFDEVGTLQKEEYYESGWPIFIITKGRFTGAPVNGRNIVRMKLPDPRTDNPAPLIYFKKAHYNTAQFPDERLMREKFMALQNIDKFTEEFSFSYPNRYHVGEVSLVSGYAQIKYCKRFELEVSEVSSDTTIRRRNSFPDAMIRINALKNRYDNHGATIKTTFAGEDLYFDNFAKEGYDGVFGVSISIEANDRVLLLALSKINRSADRTEYFPQLASSINYLDESILNTLALKSRSSKYVKGTLAGIGTDFVMPVSTLGEDDDEVDTKNIKYLTSVSLSKPEYDTLVGLFSSFEAKYPMVLTMANSQNNYDGNGVPYNVCELAVTGYQLSGTDLVVAEISSAINIYTYGNF